MTTTALAPVSGKRESRVGPLGLGAESHGVSLAYNSLDGGKWWSWIPIQRVVSESRALDLLDLVQRAARRDLVPVLSVSAVFAEPIEAVLTPQEMKPPSRSWNSISTCR